MIVVSIDPTTGRVAFISLPRDTAGVPLPRSWPAYSAFGGAYNNKINTLYTVARGRPDLFPGSDSERGFEALMGALGELYGLDIDYYVAVDLSSFRERREHARRRGRGRPAARLRHRLPLGRWARQAQAVHPAGHDAHERSAGPRLRPLATCHHRLRPLGTPAARHHLGARPDGPLVHPAARRPQRAHQAVPKDVKTNIPPKMVPALLSLAQDVDLDRRENLVLSDAAGYSSICYPCGPSRPVDAQGQAGAHARRGPERLRQQPAAGAHHQPAGGGGRHRPRPQRHGRHEPQGHQHRRLPRRDRHGRGGAARGGRQGRLEGLRRTRSSPSTTAPRRPCRRRSARLKRVFKDKERGARHRRTTPIRPPTSSSSSARRPSRSKTG